MSLIRCVMALCCGRFNPHTCYIQYVYKYLRVGCGFVMCANMPPSLMQAANETKEKKEKRGRERREDRKG